MVQVQLLRRRSAGFTLVELLVVVSIIALLIAILLPSLQKAREQAKTVICQSRIRGLGTGSVTYLADFGRYPPSLENFAVSSMTTNKAGLDWLGIGEPSTPFIAGDPFNPQTGTPKGFSAAPRFGALWPYVNNEEIYLCSKDKPGLSEDTPQGGGGNGKFSYSQFSDMGLRDPDQMPCRIISGSSSSSRGPRAPDRRMTKRALSAVPMFVEEWTHKGINAVFPGAGAEPHMEGNFNFGRDKVGLRHGPFLKRPGKWNGRTSFEQGGTNIAFADGHVEIVHVNFGYGLDDIKLVRDGGLGLPGIPHTASGLLYYYGIEHEPVMITRR